uniref:Proteasomal ATPase second OB domain-containing protein n=1 Tax=Glossina morsitans morsitans TaxID=37546 RepID=A0A1B0GBR6_GLOMM
NPGNASFTSAKLNVKTYLEKSEADIERLKNENKKLHESQQVTIRQVEKMAPKLGDAQARNFKLERDNETLSKTLEANSATIEGLQREKDLVEIEVAALKERLLQFEKGHEQLLAKIANLERVNQTLQDATQKLEARETDDKAKINKLEKVRETKEDKIRQLTAALNIGEHSNVKLNLEINALNSQLQELELDLSANYNVQIEQMELRLMRSLRSDAMSQVCYIAYFAKFSHHIALSLGLKFEIVPLNVVLIDRECLSSTANTILKSRPLLNVLQKIQIFVTFVRQLLLAFPNNQNNEAYFLPVIGLVDAEKLKPGDSVGVNKGSYLILETLPADYDARVKAMEVDERLTEQYSDISGLDNKQIQLLIEAVVLPMTHKDKFKNSCKAWLTFVK